MKTSRAALAALTVLAFAGLAGPVEAQRAAPTSAAQMQLSFAPVASRASPAVVNVYADHTVQTYANPFFQQFGVPRERMERSLGSGVIVRADGIVVTNNHVIQGGQTLRVVLADRREFNARVMLADDRVDLAVLKIDVGAERLPTLPLADTRSLQVGDLVLAIGNPFGLSQTVTSGIISALARTEVGSDSLYIQTDAPINRGNSGGALVNMNGELVGINSSILSQSGDSAGIGFAIPADLVRRVIDTAVGGGHTFVQPWIGARLQAVTPDLARSIGLDRPDGVLVAELYPRAAGERAGLQRGDVILQVAGAAVHDEAGVRYQFATQDAGSHVPLVVQRAGRRLTLTATAEAPPGGSPAPVTITGQNPLSGSRVVTLTPATAEAAGLDPFAQGVFIQALAPTGFAARVGFHPGDIIDEINGSPIRSADQVQAQLNAGARWVIGVQRGGQRADIRF
ncbi:MAG: trypsin-like peptidase domain-containing protein [Terricaulis sp.]